MTKKNESTKTVEVSRIDTSTIEVSIVGTTPMICNAMSEKVRQELLAPPKKKNRAEKETTAKHDPLAEYRRSPYRSRGDAETRIVFPGGAFKAAIMNAAVDIPGAAKAQVGRLAVVNTHNIPVWGVPQMFMAVVRQAGMTRTPDIRTRAILPEWAARVSITFVRPNLDETAVVNLIASAGIIIGLGDWRPEKGKGSFGQFRIASEDDGELARIVAQGGRNAQDAALETPTFYDTESEELYEYWRTETQRRGLKVG